MDSMCTVKPNNGDLCVVDEKLTYTPKRIVSLRGYGRICTLNDTTMKKDFYATGRLQPLCGEFGEHYPARSVMENPQTTIGWDNTLPKMKCGYQNQNLEVLASVNSQMPPSSALPGSSSQMPAAAYYSTTGDFHNGKC